MQAKESIFPSSSQESGAMADIEGKTPQPLCDADGLPTWTSSKYGAQSIQDARVGATHARDVLMKLVKADDQKAVQADEQLRLVVEQCREDQIKSVQEFSHLRPIARYLAYNKLNAVQRAIIRRVLEWPACWHTVFPLLTVDGWFEFAKCSTGRSNFDAVGGGVWLERYAKKLHGRVTRSTAKFWGKYVGSDGIEYDSLSEVIQGSLLFFNKDLLEYEFSPRLPFRGQGKKAPRYCLADFRVNVRTGVECLYPEFTVENWMRFDNLENIQSSDQVVISALKQRRFKINEYKKLEMRLVETESQVYRDFGVQEYIDHLASEYLNQAGIHLKTEGFSAPLPGTKSQSDLTLSERALLLYTFQVKTVNAGTKHENQRIRSICFQIVQNRDTSTVEVELARLQGRQSRVRNGEWIGTASSEAVRKYCSEKKFSKPMYEAAYKKNQLPAGFPAAPRQSWPQWSWTTIQGKVPRSRLVRKYETARKMVQKWQLRTGRKLKSASKYERERENSRYLLRLPKQPDNKKAGGLIGFVSWPDFLGNHPELPRSKSKGVQDAIYAEVETADAATTASVLRREELTDAVTLSRYASHLYERIRVRKDWKSILAKLAGRQELVASMDEAVKILLNNRVFTEADYRSQRADNLQLQQIPLHFDRLGKGVFMQARDAEKLRANPPSGGRG